MSLGNIRMIGMGVEKMENHYLVDLIIIGLTEVMKQLLKMVGYIYLIRYEEINFNNNFSF